MRLGSYFASIALHAMLALTVLAWPAKPRLDLSQAVQISLVDGTPGGELLASPVLGRRGDPSAQARAEARPAPETAPEAAPPPPEASPREAPSRTEPETLRPATEIPRPESVITPATPPPSPPESARLPGEDKTEPRPDPEPRPAEAKKAPEASREEQIRAALLNAQRQARPDPDPSRSRQSAVDRALANTARQVRQRGTGGGGGGEGDGEGGGGLKDTYVGLVILAVRPNWSFTTFASRQNIVVTVRIRLDREGNVLDCRVEKSSGNPGFDGSAVNAIQRTRMLPPPPTAEEQDLSIDFNSQDLTG